MFNRLSPYFKIFCTNALCIFIFLSYAFLGGLIILYIEKDVAIKNRYEDQRNKFICVIDLLDKK